MSTYDPAAELEWQERMADRYEAMQPTLHEEGWCDEDICPVCAEIRQEDEEHERVV